MRKDYSRPDRGYLRWIAAGLLLFLLFSIAPASADPLEQTRHVFVNVSNTDGVKFDLDGATYGGPNNTYYIKADGGGLNELHITADAAVAAGQVTTSTDQSGVFYVSNTGGRGFDDDIVLLLAVNGTVPDDFAVHVKTSGYTWTPSSVLNQVPTNYTYIDGAVNEIFTKEDFLYGPQTWKPGPGNAEPYLPPGLPLYEYQDVTDTSNTFSLMFIDLKVGNLYPSKFPEVTLTDNGASKVEYSFENLETFAAFNAYGWCLAANQGQGISWTNRVNAAGETAAGTSSYAVVGIPPVLTSIEVTPGEATLTVNETQQFTATAYDADGDVMTGITVAWSSSDEIVGTVDDCGNFTALAAGATTVTASYGSVSGTAAVTVGEQPGGLADSAWPMYGHDLLHTGLSSATGPEFPVKLWSYKVSSFFLVQPVLDANGTVYAGSRNKIFYALNPDGSLKWSYTAPNQIYTAAAISSDGTVYFGCRDMKIYAMNADGTVKWTFTTGGVVSSAPAIGPDGTIYAGSADMKLYAVNPDGTEKWSYTTGGAVNAAPAIGLDGTIYAGSADSSLYALNPDGTLKWSYATGGSITAASAIGADGTIYTGSTDGSLYAVNPDGTLKWSYAAGGAVAPPAIGPDGTIYAGSASKTINAVNPDGTLKWSYATAGTLTTAPAVDAAGTAYIASSDRNDRNLYAIRPDGTLKWKFIAVSPRYFDTPSIGADGTIYIGSSDSSVYAIGSTDTPAISAIAIDPSETEISTGLVQQFLALASDASGNVFANLGVAWSSSNESVGTVNATGAFTALEAGTTVLSATYGDVTGTTNVTVIPPVPVLTGITLSPSDLTVLLGDNRTFTATALDQYGEPMTGIAFAWSSSNETVGTIDVNGTFSALAGGTTTVTAANGTFSARANVTVQDPSAVASITVTPSSASLTAGDGVQFNATAYDPSSTPIEGLTFTWTCSDATVGTVNTTGYFTSLTYGRVAVTAAVGAVNGTSSVTVKPTSPVTWSVNASGGGDFTTIQAALDAAFDGDTIVVGDGTYNETLTIAKPLTLRSANGAEKTEIVSTSKYHVMVSADNTTISGFSISGSGTYGIHCRNYSGGTYSGCTFADNIISDKKVGIQIVSGSNMLVEGNTVTGVPASSTGIYLSATTDSTVANNTCLGGDIGSYGIRLVSGSTNNVLTGNTITGYTNAFSLLSGSRIDHNLVMDNTYISWGGSDLVFDNIIYANSFVNNSKLFTSSGLERGSTWNSTVPMIYTYNGATYTSYIGNYWGATYPIDDADGNGIGDAGVHLPYNMLYLYTGNVDNHPLVLPAEAYFGESYDGIPIPTTVEVSPSSAVLPGETTQQYTGTVYDQNGKPMTGAGFAWTSSDEKVGSFRGSLFSAEYAGTTTITAQSYLVKGTAEAVVNTTVLETVWTDPCESTEGWTLSHAGLQDAYPYVYSGSYSIGAPAFAGDAYAERTVVFPDAATEFRFEAFQDSIQNGVGSGSWLKAFIDNETVATMAVGQYKRGWNIYTVNITGYETGNHTFRIESHYGPTTGGYGIGFYVDQLAVRIDPAAVTPDVSSITVEPASATVTHGETQAFVATAYDAENNTVPGVSFTWTSSDETVGTVNATGTFTAHKVGTTTVSAAVGEVFGTAAVTVTPPHGDQTEDSPLNVPGCNITDNGNGTRQVLVNTTTVNATVSGNTIRIVEDTFSLIIETTGAPTVGNGTVNGTVAGITLNTTPVSTIFDDLGTVTASLAANLTGIPTGAAVQTTVSANVSADAQSAFQLAASNDGLNLDAVAYTLNVVKTNLTNGQDIADATIRMAVSQAWVDAHGGVNAIKIIRSAEDGTQEVLVTTYIGLDADGNLVFEAYSPNGLSIFGLAAAVSPTPSGSSSSGGGSSNVASFSGSVSTGATKSFTVTQTAVKQISVTARNDISDFLITVKAASLPSEIEAPVQATYQIQEIALYRADAAAIGSASIEFAVPTSWLDARGLATGDIVLLRYVDGAWTTLPTTFVEEKNGFAYFSAETPGFSYFAIAVEKSAGVGETAVATTAPAVTATTPATATTAPATAAPTQQSPLPWFAAFVALGAFLFLRRL